MNAGISQRFKLKLNSKFLFLFLIYSDKRFCWLLQRNGIFPQSHQKIKKKTKTNKQQTESIEPSPVSRMRRYSRANQSLSLLDRIIDGGSKKTLTHIQPRDLSQIMVPTKNNKLVHRVQVLVLSKPDLIVSRPVASTLLRSKYSDTYNKI